ncbi:MAG: ABC transporter permease, partial [Tissierellia bacterium]|nr:ABC transporter permease [Tissierellia bacterium]
MSKYILKRILLLIPVIIGVSFIVFALLELSPGDPVRNILGTNADPKEVEALREEMGLNDPFLVRYGRFLKNMIINRDLGDSYLTR